MATAPLVIPSNRYTMTSSGSNSVIWGGWNYKLFATDAGVWIPWVETSNCATTSITASNAITVNDVITIWEAWNFNPPVAYADERVRNEQARRKNADERAMALLMEHLTEKQRQQFEKERVFEVIGGKHKHRYRIFSDGHVRRLDEQGEIERYCIHTPGFSIPTADEILAKKLMLELDEPTFLKTANATRLRA